MAQVGCPDRRIERHCITCCSPSQPLRQTGDVGATSFRPPARPTPDSVRFSPSSPRPSWRACRQARWPRPWWAGPWPMIGAMVLSVADYGERISREQATQISIALVADAAKLVFAPLELCFGKRPTQAEKSRPDRKALGSAMLATSAVASTGPTPGIASSPLLVVFDRCQAMMRRSDSRIWAFSARN